MTETQGLRLMHSKLVDWLVNSDIRTEDGAVMSWLNNQKPGYVYLESTGFYVKFFSFLYAQTGNEKYLDLAKQSSLYISRKISEQGAAYRGELDYVFDSSICASGLMALGKISELEEERQIAIERLVDFIYSSLSQRTFAFSDGIPLSDSAVWSANYGPSVLRSCNTLLEANDAFDKPEYKDLVLELTEEIMRAYFKNGVFEINGGLGGVYTHVHCYATEGLLYLASHGIMNPELEEAVSWLGKKQNDDGSMDSWYDTRNWDLCKPVDAAAQAIRLWTCTDPLKYSDNIKRGLEFLKDMQSDEGGMFYCKMLDGRKSQDINSWTSMFAARAIGWQLETPSIDWLV